ncbi:hypothetical protein, partial [Empedobacter brevis]|uniref:hypothetical protein n=1 Tax=Empedobacter brevis TaxID=247 RepID=UPI00333F5A81
MRKNIILFALLIVGNTFGQQTTGSNFQYFPNGFKENIYPKSPEAAAFSKYTDIPASSFTGVVNISIPIYEFDFEGKKFPISLEYNTSGIKLDEIASRVGLGWTLNIGGVSLSKQIMGYPDNSNLNKSIISSNFNPNEDRNTFGKISGYNGNVSDGSLVKSGFAPNDLEPDIYSYSTLEGSGKFILDFKTNDILTFPYRKIKKNGSPLSFIEENGNIYTFLSNGFEYLQQNTCNNQIDDFDNRYRGNIYISSIESPNKNNRIDFSYTTANSKQLGKSYLISASEKIIIHKNPTNVVGFPAFPEICYSYHKVYAEDSKIKQISFKGGVIEFIYSSQYDGSYREDLSGDVYLKRILVKNDQNQIIRDFVLNISYWVTTDSYDLKNSNSISDKLEGINKRLFLNSVKNQLTKEEYKIDYYEGNIGPRISNRKDYWGVYNGSNNNSSIGKLMFNNTNFTYGENLLPNLDFAKRGNLKKITYPTEGNMQLEYELDEFIVPDNLKQNYLNKGFLIENGSTKSGSIRVSNIELNDAIKGKIRKEFSYINPRTNKSSGVYYSSHIVNNFGCDIHLPGNGNPKTTYFYASNNPGWQLNTINGKSIGYTHVVEKIIDTKNSQNSYKKLYEYISHEGNDDFPYMDEFTDYDGYSPLNFNYPFYRPERGLLDNVTFFNSNNDITKFEKNEYEYNSNPNKESSAYLNDNSSILFRGFLWKFNDEVCWFLLGGISCKREIDYLTFFLSTYWIQNKKTISTEYFPNGNVVTTTENNYSPSYKHLYPTNTTTKNSKGETITTEYQYPPDLTGNYIQNAEMIKLVNTNRISEPVIINQKVGDVYTSEVRNQYNEFNGIIQKSAVYQKRGKDIGLGGTFDRVIKYDSYDTKGNLTQYTLENGIPVAIIWGYNGQYPIAKIEGISYTDLTKSTNYTSNIINALVDQTTNSPQNTAHIKDLFNQLRVNELCKDALVTTYQYKPLVGVTSITGPNGQTEYYNYDTANRLKSIVNDQNEV